MKLMFAFAGALLLLTACGSSKEAKEAVSAMNLDESGSGWISWDSKSGSGAKMTYKGVTIRFDADKAAGGIKAETMVFDGLGMDDGEPVFKELTFTKLTPVYPEGMSVPKGLNVGADTLTLKDASPELSTFVAKTLQYMAKGGKGKSPEPPKIEKVAFGRLALMGLHVNGKDIDIPADMDGQGGKMNVDGRLNEISISGVNNLSDSGGSVGRFLFGGLSLKADGTQGEMKFTADAGLDEISLDGARIGATGDQKIDKFLIKNVRAAASANGAGQNASMSGNIGEVSLAGFKVVGDTGAVDLGSFKIANVSAKLDGDTPDTRTPKGGNMKVHADAGIGEISLNGFKVDLNQNQTRFDGVKVAGISIGAEIIDPAMPAKMSLGLGEFSVAGYDMATNKLGPIKLNGLKGSAVIPKAFEPGNPYFEDTTPSGGSDYSPAEIAQAMRTVGVRDLEMHLSADTNYQQDTDTLRLTAFNFGAQNLGELNVTAGLKGLSTAASGGEPDLVDMQLTYADKKFVDVVFQVMAMADGGSPASLRADAVKQLRKAATQPTPDGKPPTPLARDLSNAMANLLERPGTLTMRFAPARPVPMAAFEDPAREAELGFSVTYKPN